MAKVYPRSGKRLNSRKARGKAISPRISMVMNQVRTLAKTLSGEVYQGG